MKTSTGFGIALLDEFSPNKKPAVMGILNVTSDSFFEQSRKQTDTEILERAKQILAEGAVIIDVGACSTRPGAEPTGREEEERRLLGALSVIKSELPNAVISVDTFRPELAAICIDRYQVEIINDVGAPADSLGSEQQRKAMFEVVASRNVHYVLTSRASGIEQMKRSFGSDIKLLEEMGVTRIILDPGYGFGKTLEQNYSVLKHQRELLRFNCPLLAGISRKRMIWQPLGITPDEALNGTTALHMLALQGGATILRAHDVKAAVETVRLNEILNDVY